MEEELDGAEEAAHALVAQPFAFEVRGGVPTVHTSASVGGEQWKQRWQQCMRDTQRGGAVCVEAMQATRTFGRDAYHLLHVNYEDKADDHRLHVNYMGWPPPAKSKGAPGRPWWSL